MKEFRLPKLPNFDRLPKLPRPGSIPLPKRLAALAAPPIPGHNETPVTNSPGALQSLLKPLRAINWRIIFAALTGMAILHIVATLAAPYLAMATAFERMRAALPVNTMVALPQIEPGAQPLPYLSPALRYAMCRFDSSKAPVQIDAELNALGSSLTIYSTDGEALYAAAASESPSYRVKILPTDGRFLGLTPEARGLQNKEVPSATIQAQRGLVVLAIPEHGQSYQRIVQQTLDAASCRAVPAAGS